MKKILSIFSLVTFSVSTLGSALQPPQALALSPVPTVEITDQFNLKAHVSSWGTKLSWDLLTDDFSPDGNPLAEGEGAYYIKHSSSSDALKSFENDSSDSPYEEWMDSTAGENIFSYTIPHTNLIETTYYAVCVMYQDLSQTCSRPIKAELKKTASAFFSDVNSSLPNFIAIESLARARVVKGNPDGTFAIGRVVNRAEMMRLVLANQNISPDPTIYKNCFPDVKEEWFAPDVCYAKEKGWVEGNPDGLFHPEATVAAPAVLKMILKPLFEEDLASQTQEQIKTVADEVANVDVEDWYAPYVTFAKNKGLLHDSFDDLFRINQDSYRALVAEYLFRARMLKNEGWQVYHPHLRDRALQGVISKDLLGDETLCHSAVGLPTPDFVFHYMKSKYDVSYTYRDEIPTFYKDRVYPFYDPGYICLLKDGGTLVSNAIMATENQVERHLIHFDAEANLIKDEKQSCDSSSHSDALKLENGVDSDTLEMISCSLLKDKNYIYDGNAVETIDLTTLENIGGNFFKDHNRAYWHATLEVEEADIASFEFVGGDYARDKDHIYYHYQPLEEADPETFEVVGKEYAKDVQQAYYGDLPFKVDLGTFEEIDSYPYNYAKDKAAVYRSGKKLPEVDMETFQIMDDAYSKDKDSVYYSEDIIPGADAQSFEIIDTSYAKDKSRVYFRDEVLVGLDPANFQILETGDRSDGIGVFVRDSDQVFYLSEELTWVDAATFEILGWGYAKDKNYAISGSETIPNMDPATFEVIEAWLPEVHTKDKNGTYCGKYPQTDGHCVTYPLFGRPQSIPITF